MPRKNQLTSKRLIKTGMVKTCRIQHTSSFGVKLRGKKVSGVVRVLRGAVGRGHEGVRAGKS